MDPIFQRRHAAPLARDISGDARDAALDRLATKHRSRQRKRFRELEARAAQ
jgi:hypothetical protein